MWRGAGGTFDAEKAGGQHLLSSPILLSVFRFLAVVAVTAKNERNTKESANLKAVGLFCLSFALKSLRACCFFT